MTSRLASSRVSKSAKSMLARKSTSDTSVSTRATCPGASFWTKMDTLAIFHTGPGQAKHARGAGPGVLVIKARTTSDVSGGGDGVAKDSRIK